jgi:hypothetical protein
MVAQRQRLQVVAGAVVQRLTSVYSPHDYKNPLAGWPRTAARAAAWLKNGAAQEQGLNRQVDVAEEM